MLALKDLRMDEDATASNTLGAVHSSRVALCGVLHATDRSKTADSVAGGGHYASLPTTVGYLTPSKGDEETPGPDLMPVDVQQSADDQPRSRVSALPSMVSFTRWPLDAAAIRHRPSAFPVVV